MEKFMKAKFLLSGLFVCAIAIGGASCSSQNQATNNAAPQNNSHAGINHRAGNIPASHQGMNHGEMDHSKMKTSPDAANAPFDLQFLDTMIAHHKGAIEMAKDVETKAGRAEIKALAKNIIADQEKEIAQMKKWRDEWFPGKPAALNMQMPGMSDSMKMMSGGEMQKLEASSGKDFDLLFLDMMIPHHQGAVTMAKEALQKAEHPEIKTLANQIIKAQQNEIKKMTDWKAQRSK
jgi:uncharacterized protein (DUF305 family)